MQRDVDFVEPKDMMSGGVLAAATKLFDGDVVHARAWLSMQAPALGYRVPMAVAMSEEGTREVLELIGRLEHGVFT